MATRFVPDIRPASPASVDAIATLHVASWKSAYRGILPDALLDRLKTEDRVRDWTRWLAVPEARTYVAQEGRRLVGFARILPTASGPEPAPGSGEISHLYVDPEAQGHGVGGALLAHALRDLHSLGRSHAVLWVLEKNYRARAFYERAGFSLDGARRTDPELLGSDAPEVRYQISVEDRARR